MNRQADRPLRVALFGGSFDPIHLGHVFIAQRAQQEIGLDKVIFIPAHRSPFKKQSCPTAAAHRLAMVALATRELPWAVVSDYETALADTSYSWRTAEHFRSELQESGQQTLALYWILGTDQWSQLTSWSRAPYLARLVEFIVFCRDEETPQTNPPFRGHFIKGSFAASSTAIRAQLAAGTREGLPLDAQVLEYITANRLYCSD